MTFGPVHVRAGMEVVETGGAPIGRVKEARAEDFVVERAEAVTLCCPPRAIRAMLDDQIVLNLRAHALDSVG